MKNLIIFFDGDILRVCVCVCVRVCARTRPKLLGHARFHDPMDCRPSGFSEGIS